MSLQWFEMLEVVFSLSDQFSESHGSIQGTQASSSICPICQQTGVSQAWAHLGVMHFTSPHGDHMPQFMPEFLGQQLIVSSCTLDSVLIWAIHCIITLMSSTSMGQNSISSSHLTSRKAGKSMSTRGRPVNFGECKTLPDAHVKAPKSYPLQPLPFKHFLLNTDVYLKPSFLS